MLQLSEILKLLLITLMILMGFCSIPLKRGAQGRSTGGFMRSAPNVGIILDQYRSLDSPTTNWITNVRLPSFLLEEESSTCLLTF